jgi:hypothetical protein
VIFALRHPALLLGLLLGFVLGVALRAEVQRMVSRPGGLFGRRRLAPVGGRGGRPKLGWAGYIDPFGAVAAVLGGAGWGPRPAPRFGTSSDWLLLVAALLVHGLLAVIGFAAFVALGGHMVDLNPNFVGMHVSDVLRGQGIVEFFRLNAVQLIALGFAVENVACGLLALVPLPPLELGVALWSRLPKSPGARRIAYHVLEEHWGVGIVLLLILLPIGGLAPPLLAVIDAVGDAIFRAF